MIASRGSTSTVSRSARRHSAPRLRSLTYRYDGCTRANGIDRYEWDGLALDSRNGVEYVNEPSVTGGNPVADSEGRSYFNDRWGNTLAIIDGDKVELVEMTAFGEPLNEAAERAFFTGKPYVKELGYVFLFRNYRPEFGKWQTADPLGYPDGWNNLAYVNNGVTNAIDYLGSLLQFKKVSSSSFSEESKNVDFGNALYKISVAGSCGNISSANYSGTLSLTLEGADRSYRRQKNSSIWGDATSPVSDSSVLSISGGSNNSITTKFSNSGELYIANTTTPSFTVVIQLSVANIAWEGKKRADGWTYGSFDVIASIVSANYTTMNKAVKFAENMFTMLTISARKE